MVSNSTLSGNSATYGGGIYNDHGILTVSNSTLSGNSATYDGGGIYNSFYSVTVSNSTFSGNSAGFGSFSGLGGAIYNQATLILSNCTFSGNSAAPTRSGIGGGIYNIGGLLHAWNNIIADNTASSGPDLWGYLGSLGHNLIGSTGGAAGFDPTDLLNVRPLLGPLQNNGGPTQTMALLPGSPAIDAGDTTGAPDTDQRGFPRIVGGTIDIGAFEVQGSGQATHLGIQAPASISAGTPFSITVTALDDFGQPATAYTGTAHFTLTCPVTAMADYTFTADDMGQHTFSNLVLRRAGTYTVAGADTDTGLITGSTTFTIRPAAADHIAFTVPSTITAGVPFAITVTVQDAYGNTVTGYTGTVHFQLTGTVTPSADHTFTATDMGSHTFSGLVLNQPGMYTLTATDSADPSLSGSTLFTVSA
jgi:hypothetical protein